jgi:hypothetical protein
VVISETQEIRILLPADPRRTIIIDAEEGHEASVTRVRIVSTHRKHQVIVVDQDNL